MSRTRTFLARFFHAWITGGKMVIRNFKYTAEDVDCRYCTEFRHGQCRAQKCPWLKERIEAGVLSYREAVNEAFADPSPLQARIKIVFRHYKKSFWRDKIHAQRFDRMQAILGYYQERNTNAFYAALFLLSSDEELLRRVANCFILIKESSQRLVIKVENPCRANLTFDETIYGVGIRSVIATATKYEGMYDFTAEDGIFSAKTILNLK